MIQHFKIRFDNTSLPTENLKIITNLQTPTWQRHVQSRCAAANSALTINTAAWIFQTFSWRHSRLWFFSQKLGIYQMAAVAERSEYTRATFFLTLKTRSCWTFPACWGWSMSLGLGHFSDTSFCFFPPLHFRTKCLISFNSCSIKPQGPAAVWKDTCVSSTDPWCTGLRLPS